MGNITKSKMSMVTTSMLGDLGAYLYYNKRFPGDTSNDIQRKCFCLDDFIKLLNGYILCKNTDSNYTNSISYIEIGEVLSHIKNGEDLINRLEGYFMVIGEVLAIKGSIDDITVGFNNKKQDSINSIW
jgi:hypothetical protein